MQYHYLALYSGLPRSACKYSFINCSNGDNQIDAGEYALFFDIMGLDPKLAEEAFKAIDTNNDGLLSLDEFKAAGLDFFMSKDANSPSKVFWGPLV